MATKYYRVSPNKWEGVYYYESTSKTFNGKPDVCYVVNYKTSNRKIWEKIGWKSNGINPQVAQQYRAKRIQEIQLGAPVVTASERKAEQLKRNRTIGEIADIYFETRGSNLKGCKHYKNCYKLHIAPLFADMRIPALTPFDMETVKRNMAGKADATIWNAFELIRRIINFGYKTMSRPGSRVKVF